MFVAVCCSVVQCVAVESSPATNACILAYVCCSAIFHCNAPRRTAQHCNTLQHRAILHRLSPHVRKWERRDSFRGNTLQRIATHCNTGLFFIDCRPHVGSDLNHLDATHCNTLQHTATQGYFGHRLSSYVRNWEWRDSFRRNTPQHTATHCNTDRNTHCNTLQHSANSYRLLAACPQSCESLMQHTATHRNTPQHTTTHRNTPQHTATQGYFSLIVGRMSAVMWIA